MEQGTHSELLVQDGVYKQLVMRQLMTGDNMTGHDIIMDSYIVPHDTSHVKTDYH